MRAADLGFQAAITESAPTLARRHDLEDWSRFLHCTRDRGTTLFVSLRPKSSVAGLSRAPAITGKGGVAPFTRSLSRSSAKAEIAGFSSTGGAGCCNDH